MHDRCESDVAVAVSAKVAVKSDVPLLAEIIRMDHGILFFQDELETQKKDS
jgi:hypothetical protein